jgi:formate dehydrogenase iron-sulfur subunit
MGHVNLAKSKATLIDTTKCIGCRSCQVSCKQWNGLAAEKTALDGAKAGLQHPSRLSARTLAVVTFNEVADTKAPGGMRYVMAKRQCMHCDEPACASACPVTAMHKTKEGPVVYDSAKCIGCRYCVAACPFGVPTADWDSLAPKIHKCTMCHERSGEGAPAERNGVALSPEQRQALAGRYAIPACAKACPSDAIQFGEREELLRLAHARIQANPGKYTDRVYGEKEAGGTAMLYLSSVPFERLGFPEVGTVAYPRRSAVALGAVPPAVIGVGAALGGAYVLHKRRAEVAKEAAIAAQGHGAGHDAHVEFEPVRTPLRTPAGWALMALMAFGAGSLALRFALGLGATTNLSDTYPWGLWIVFDLVWIAVAAGAFATAGLIYVGQRKDLYSVGRAAVLMGLLSYSFVAIPLVADLGLPWHFYQLGLQAPEHSALFEVTWCINLYLTILALEFMPVPLAFFGWKRAMEAWRRYAPAWVVFAVTLFVYLMSRKWQYAAAAGALFAFLGYAFRQREGEKPLPILLAIAAVTLSTMHQSSLGSLFLLMPDKLDPLWWSPVLPVYFFLSSVAAGMALMILVEKWIAKAFGRPLRVSQLAAMGKITFWALLVYEAVRLGDVALRGRLGGAFSGRHGALFLAELAAGGLLPLLLLSTRSLRERPRVLAAAAFLTAAGVALNRMNVVMFGMDMKGPMPQLAPHAYAPSLLEWGVSVGPIAATIFLFGLAVRLLPVLPKVETTGHAPVPDEKRQDPVERAA